jgi:hypothetical protein
MGEPLNDAQTLYESGVEVKGTLYLKLLANEDEFFISDFLPPDSEATMEVEIGFAGTVLSGSVQTQKRKTDVEETQVYDLTLE